MRSAAPVTQNHLSKPEELMLQNATLSGNQHPDLLTSLMNMSLVLHLPRDMHLSRSSSHLPRLTSFLKLLQKPRVLLTVDKVHNPSRLPRETTSERPKVACGAFDILTSTFASRHNGVHFFDISTSKSAPDLVCFARSDWKCVSRHDSTHFFNISTSKSGPRPSVFNTFDFEMCFAPQRRALFRHLNVQKCSENGVLCTFWLRHVLRATTAGVPFFIYALASLFFDLRSHKPLEKHNESQLSTFYSSASASSFFWLFLFSHLLSSSLLWLFPPLLFHLSMLSEVWLLNFLRLCFSLRLPPRVHIKLPWGHLSMAGGLAAGNWITLAVASGLWGTFRKRWCEGKDGKSLRKEQYVLLLLLLSCFMHLHARSYCQCHHFSWRYSRVQCSATASSRTNKNAEVSRIPIQASEFLQWRLHSPFLKLWKPTTGWTSHLYLAKQLRIPHAS